MKPPSFAKMLRHTTAAGFLLGAILISAAASTGERVSYIHVGALGSPASATDSAATIFDRDRYAPYGARERQEAAANANTRWYTGHLEDQTTGLLYAGARWYDPTLGRFLSTDTQGVTFTNLQSFNRYAYANNNPYRYVDPDGNVAETVADVISLGLSLNSFLQEPSLFNALGVAVDVVGTAIPFVPAGFGTIRAIGGGIDVARGARQAPVELTAPGERFVRVGAEPRNLNFTFEHPGGTAPRTFAVPEKVFNEIGRDPAKLKDLLDLPGSPPTVFRTIEPPPGTQIQRGIVPGGQNGGRGGAPEVFFPHGF